MTTLLLFPVPSALARSMCVCILFQLKIYYFMITKDCHKFLQIVLSIWIRSALQFRAIESFKLENKIQLTVYFCICPFICMYVCSCMYVWLLCKIYGNLLHNVKYKLQCTHRDAHARTSSLCLSPVRKMLAFAVFWFRHLYQFKLASDQLSHVYKNLLIYGESLILGSSMHVSSV